MANAGGGVLAEDSARMSSDLIVSYDGTANDDDALALGRLLAGTGASLSLAYIRHSREFDPAREELAQHDAVRRLEQGAAWLQDSDIPKRVVFSGSTGEGLEHFDEQEIGRLDNISRAGFSLLWGLGFRLYHLFRPRPRTQSRAWLVGLLRPETRPNHGKPDNTKHGNQPANPDHIHTPDNSLDQ